MLNKEAIRKKKVLWATKPAGYYHPNQLRNSWELLERDFIMVASYVLMSRGVQRERFAEPP